MMIGSYPCCGAPLMIELPDRTPAFAPEECPHCGTKVWHRLSRLDPQTWTEEAFLEEFIVDDESRSITERNPSPPLTPEELAQIEALQDEIFKDFFSAEGEAARNSLKADTSVFRQAIQAAQPVDGEVFQATRDWLGEVCREALVVNTEAFQAVRVSLVEARRTDGDK